MVDISSDEWANKELAMRIKTDIISQDTSICVDLNGYQVAKAHCSFFLHVRAVKKKKKKETENCN